MSKQTDSLEKIINAGANLIVENAGEKPAPNLLRLVQAAVDRGEHITLRKCEGKPIEALVEIALIGGKNVTIGA